VFICNHGLVPIKFIDCKEILQHASHYG
jgi:hypothetical protein